MGETGFTAPTPAPAPVQDKSVKQTEACGPNSATRSSIKSGLEAADLCLTVCRANCNTSTDQNDIVDKKGEALWSSCQN